jgi:hypothetical protein
MYQDDEIVGIIRQLLALKDEAVRTHDYLKAAQLKDIIATLQLV